MTQQQQECQEKEKQEDIITHDMYQETIKRKETLKKELESTFSVLTDKIEQLGSHYFYNLSLANKDSKIVWSPLPKNIGEIKQYGNFRIQMIEKNAEDIRVKKANGRLYSSYGNYSYNCPYDKMCILWKENDPDWIDQYTGQPAKFPLANVSYYGFSNFEVLGKSLPNYNRLKGTEFTWYTHYLESFAKVPVFINAITEFEKVHMRNYNNQPFDRSQEYYYHSIMGLNYICSDDSLIAKSGINDYLIAEKTKHQKQRNALMKKINDCNKIINAYDAGSSLNAYSEKKKEEREEKLAINRGMRAGKEFEAFTKMLLTISKIKESIKEIDARAADENGKFNLSYINNKITKLEELDRYLQSLLQVE